MNPELRYSLEQLEMIGDDHGVGLVPVKELSEIVKLPPEEIIAIETAKNYSADYVYFRRFNNRPSVAQVYLYDYTDKQGVEDEELTNLHKQLYSSGQVPMFFVFTKKDVRIFNCFEPPAKKGKLKYTPLTTIEIASDLSSQLDSFNRNKFKSFSGKYFDNGTFWENSEYSKSFKFGNSAYERLLTELKLALRDIVNQGILPEQFVRKTMVVSILIKYLEEREDDKGNKVFPKNFFSKFSPNAKRFTDVLRKKGAYLELLDFLAEHFNGGIFLLEKDERNFLQKNDLKRFAQFLDGETEGVQLVFWRLYSFNDLPVELISNIYEEFLGKKPGVVYTPPYLVNFLLDEAMPLSSSETEFKVLDPACGSGVFLVGAYRRLIYRWRCKNRWNNPDLATLKRLLKKNIYGVELNKEAADLTVFSLSLALCDELTPLQIWKDLKFDDLHEANILHKDFFDTLINKSLPNKFDLIIGNPPFESKLTKPAAIIEAKEKKTRVVSFDYEESRSKKENVNLPDNQVALLFLEQSMTLCKDHGLVCMIQPSGPLLYNNSSVQFRKTLFEKYNIPQIIDFTHISRVLFGKNGDVATAAIFIRNEKAKRKPVLHITPRRTKTHKEKLYFELDTYDFHHVPYKTALNDTLIWKSNFLGGARAHQIIKRLATFRTLGEFLEIKKEESGWASGEGYIVGKNESYIKRLKLLDEKNKNKKLTRLEKEELVHLEERYKAKNLTGSTSFDPKHFTTTGISETYVLDALYFACKRNPLIYKAPHLIIKEVVEDGSFTIPIKFLNRDISFKNSIFGIHGNSAKELKEIEMHIKNNHVVSFYLAGTSGRFMVNKSSSLLATDIKNIPYPEVLDDMCLSDVENVVVQDFIKYLVEFRRKGETSEIVTSNVSKNELSLFKAMFCKILSSVFTTIKPYKHFETDSYICTPFYFGKKPEIDFSDKDKAELHLENLVMKKSGASLKLTRIIRLYEGNIIYLIKPKKLRYWIQSVALRDADETFSDLRKQGY